MKYQIKVNNKLFNVTLISRSREKMSLDIEGSQFEVDLTELRVVRNHDQPSLGGTTPVPKREELQREAKKAVVRSSNSIVSPIPGVVADILVKPNDSVSHGQPLVVVEAMKMQNNICASRDGVVKSIKVAIGDEVQANQILVEL